MTDRRPLLRAIFDAAVAAAHPDAVLASHLRPVPKGRVIVLAAGKGAAAMAAAAERHYLDALKLERVSVVGTSLGGWIALALALVHPTRVERLVLAAPAGIRVDGVERYDYFANPVDETLRRLFHDPTRAAQLLPTEYGAEVVVRGYHEFTTLARLSWNPYLYDPKLQQRLRRVRTPTLLIWGAEDRVLPPAHGRAFAELMPFATLSHIHPGRVFLGVGHFLVGQRGALAHLGAQILEPLAEVLERLGPLQLIGDLGVAVGHEVAPLFERVALVAALVAIATFVAGLIPRLVVAIALALVVALRLVAGALIANFFYTSPTVGETLAIIDFVTVSFGGFGSVLGALVAGLIIGVVESLSAYLIGPVYKDVVVYILFVLVLWFRPLGLMCKT